ncbi:MAG: aerial mycelium formation protein [Micrococcales bacterium]|nr:MAG: aerial mycelium formation protein [Micrococcales bacterium]PIE26859.1 MAG: aerial mycelium formation protein [Micrococcales bacterium]
MSDDVVPGGRRRIDRVLAPEFIQDLGDVSDEELVSRQNQAVQEEADLSYVRRLVQGRLDQLRAEVHRRGHGGDDASVGIRSDEELVAMLSSALAEPRPPATRSGRYVDAEHSEPKGRRREIEKVAGDIELSDPRGLSDDALKSAVTRLAELEERASLLRRQVQRVADVLEEAMSGRGLYGA